MSGGAWKYTMGVLADDEGNPRSGNRETYNSGFNGTLYNDGAGGTYLSGISFPNNKYYDLYTTSSPLTACNGDKCYGHALYETAGWYSDYALFVYSDYPWFGRGGTFNVGTAAGAFFSSNGHGRGDGCGFRSAVIKGA